MDSQQETTVRMAAGTGAGILVVDDEPTVMQLVARMLRQRGFVNVICAERGLEALRLLGVSEDGKLVEGQPRQPVALVILDIVLPDLNGVEVCRRLKRARPDVAVLLITGNDIEFVQQRLLESGADDFLTKPFKPVELATRVNLLLRHQDRAAAAQAMVAKERSAVSPRMPYIGDHIGDYVIVDTLGWGKSSIVFRAVSQSSHEPCVIKMLTRYAAEFKEVVARFRNEARIMSQLRHPNVVRLEHTGEHEGCPFLVLEYFPGIDLEEYIVSRGRPDFDRFLGIARDLARALQAVHGAGIVHRDVKLKNVLVIPATSQIKLSDFGIALASDSPHVTQDGLIIGTPLYMAPEVFTGDPATVRSDIYSYGATLYHLLTGSPPFVAERSKELYEKHLQQFAPALATFRPGIPPAWDELIIGRCLAKDPNDRPADMADVLAHLDRLALARF